MMGDPFNPERGCFIGTELQKGKIFLDILTTKMEKLFL